MTIKISKPIKINKPENPLAPVFRRVDSPNEPVDNHSSHIVIVDCSGRRRQILDKVPLWSNFDKVPLLSKVKSNVKYFLVSNTNNPLHVANCDGFTYQVDDFEKQRVVRLKIRYKVQCVSENREKVALVLSEGEQPEQTLVSLIKRWVREYTSGHEGYFIDHFYDEHRKLENHLRQKALDEAGLTLSSMVSSLELEGDLPEINLTDFQIPIYVRDYRDKVLILKLNLETEVNDTEKLPAILSQLDEPKLQKLIRKPVENYFSDNVSLEQFYYEPDTTVQPFLLKELAPLVKKEWRDIKTLKLETSPPIDKNYQTDIELRFEKQVGDRFKGMVEFNVKMRLKFQSQHVVDYVKKGCPDLSSWGKENSERIFDQLLFHKKYEELADFGSLERDFESQLKKAAEEIGCGAENITVSIEIPNSDDGPFNTEIEVSVKLLDFSNPITVRNQVKMSKQSQRKYMEKHMPSLDSWLETELKNTFDDVLFGVDCLKFFTNFHEYDTQIRNKMREEAQNIGYKLDQLIIKPQLELLREPFRIDISEQFFTTKVGNKVPLKIVVDLSISEVKYLCQYFSTGIKNEIESVIIKVTESELIKIEPYRFYMCFEYSSIHGEVSVMQLLKQQIEKELQEKFAATVKNIAPIMEKEKDEVLKRQEELISQHGELNFEVTPYSGGEVIPFTAEFDVMGVDATRDAQTAWYTFIKRKFGISEIKARLENYLKAKMQALPPGSLQFTTPEHLNKLENWMFGHAQDCAITQFGVGIMLTTPLRKRTTIEVDEGDVKNEKARAWLRQEYARIKQLERKIDSQLENANTLNESNKVQLKAKIEEIKQINEQIKEITIQGLDQSETQALKDRLDELEKDVQNYSGKSEDIMSLDEGKALAIPDDNTQGMAALDASMSPSQKQFPQQQPQPDNLFVEKRTFVSLENDNQLQNKLRYVVDVVLCIDATGSMDGLINKVKTNGLKFFDDLNKTMADKEKFIELLRVKVIVFRDSYSDGEKSIQISPFYILPQESDKFADFVYPITATGGGEEPKNSLEALALAIKSDWSTEGDKRKQIIVLWTDASAHPLSESKLSNYPKDMPRDFDELTDLWEGQEYIEMAAKRLILYTPDVAPWTDISTYWTNVVHYPSRAGEGLSELDYQSILDAITNSV